MTGSGSMPGGAGTEEQLSLGTSRGRWVIAATVLGSGIASLDATVVGIALPDHRSGLPQRRRHAAVGRLRLRADAGRLPPARRLAGRPAGAQAHLLRRGRLVRRGLRLLRPRARTPACSIAARVLQGVGGALLAPASLAILQASFRPDDRPRAIGAWSGLGWRGYRRRAAPGRVPDRRRVVALGVLHQRPGRRLVLARHRPPRARDPRPLRRRATSTSLGAAPGRPLPGRASPTGSSRHPVTAGPARRCWPAWSSPRVAGPAFLVVEHASAHPMLPLGLFRTRQFSGANAVTFVVYGALGGALFLLPVELQLVAHYSPARVRAGPAAGDRHHAGLLGPLGTAGRAHRSPAPDDGRAVRGGGRPAAPDPGHAQRELRRRRCCRPCSSSASGWPSRWRRSPPPPWARRRPSTPGVASAVNNVVARAAGLLAVAVLPLLAGITGAAALDRRTTSPPGSGPPWSSPASPVPPAAFWPRPTIRNPPVAPRPAPPRTSGGYHCALDGTPLQRPTPPARPGRGLSSARPRGDSSPAGDQVPDPGVVGYPARFQATNPPSRSRHRGAAQVEQAGGSQAGGVALLADDDYGAARVLRLDQPV